VVMVSASVAAGLAGTAGAPERPPADDRPSAAASSPAQGVIGRSLQGRELAVRRWGAAGSQRAVLVVGSIHGDETEGHRIVERLIDRGARRLRLATLWTLETANPDGVAARTRGNARGVDLNRNFPWNWREIPASSGYYSGPGPVSEPETRSLRRFLRRLRPEVTIWYHEPWGETLIPCDRSGRRVALRYAGLSGLEAGVCIPSPPGSATGFQGNRLGAKAFVVELPGRALRPGEVDRHARAVLAIARGG
jgi:protein MpaA